MAEGNDDKVSLCGTDDPDQDPWQWECDPWKRDSVIFGGPLGSIVSMKSVKETCISSALWCLLQCHHHCCHRHC